MNSLIPRLIWYVPFALLLTGVGIAYGESPRTALERDVDLDARSVSEAGMQLPDPLLLKELLASNRHRAEIRVPGLDRTGSPDIDPETARAIAEARARWEWGVQMHVVSMIPAYDASGKLMVYDVLLSDKQSISPSTLEVYDAWQELLSEIEPQLTYGTPSRDPHPLIPFDAVTPSLITVIVSATFDQSPVLGSHLGPPSLYRDGWVAAELGAAAIGQPARLSRILMAGVRKRLYEFRAEGTSVVVQGFSPWAWAATDEFSANAEIHAAANRSRLQDRITAEGLTYDEFVAGERNRNADLARRWLDGPLAPAAATYITGYPANFVPFELLWIEPPSGNVFTSELAPAMAQTLNYYDERFDYGRLTRFHQNRTVTDTYLGHYTKTTCHNADSTPILYDLWLAGPWSDESSYHDVMIEFANDVRGYSFNPSINFDGSVLDWHWDDGRQEIDANRPFMWSPWDHLQSVRDQVTVVGYDSSPWPYEWIVHWPGSMDGLPERRSYAPGINWTAWFSGTNPGGEGQHNAKLTFPDGDYTWNSCDVTEHLRATGTTTIRWENWDNPADHVNIFYSVDQGASWQEIVSGREDVGWYNWDVPCDIGDSVRVLIQQYDVGGFLQSEDGSYGSADIVASGCDAIILNEPVPDQECLSQDVRLAWFDIACAVRYEVEVEQDGPPYDTFTYEVTTNEVIATGLSANTWYWWRVFAVDACGASAGSGSGRRFRTGPEQLAPPTPLTPADGSTCEASAGSLDWSDVPGAIGYQVQIGRVCGGENTIHGTVSSDYAFTGLIPKRTYFWRVRSVDSCGNHSEWSNCASFTIISPPPPTPALLSPADGAPEQLPDGTLVWQGNSGATGYQVRLGTSCGSGTIYTPALGATSLTYSGLSNFTTYHWQVRSYDGCDQYSTWSDCFSFTVRTPATILVKPDGSGDFPTIQAAVNNSIDGDIIELADGVFLGGGNRDVDLLDRSLVIRSQSGDPTTCIIDCEGHETSTHRGFSMTGGQGYETVLSGMTIRNAYLSGTGSGGGIYISGSDPVIRDCVISFCGAYDGAGVLIVSGSPQIIDCRFELNYAADAGGGILVSNGSPIISGCYFGGNSAVWGGGGIYNLNASPSLSECTFSANSSDNWGGGIHNAQAGSNPDVIQCTFTHNSAPQGGAIYNRQNAGAVIDRTIIAFSPIGEAAYCTTGGTISLVCCDVYGNAGGDFIGCLSGQQGVNGNFSSDPLMCLPENNDVSLHSDSPCAEDNNASCGRVGALGIGCGAALPTTVFVNADGTGDYPTIQAAIDDVAWGSTIFLANGIYTGDGNRDLDFKLKQITLRSQSNDPAACIIDCEASASEPHRGFHFFSGEGQSSVVRGITVRNGFAADKGGAVLCEFSSSPRFTKCVFENNVSGGHGGAITCEYSSSPVFTTSTFRDNFADSDGGAVSAFQASSPSFGLCSFEGNIASIAGGVLKAAGDCLPIVETSTIVGNAAEWGGGIYSTEGSIVTVMSCTFYGNAASTSMSRSISSTERQAMEPEGSKGYTGNGNTLYAWANGSIAVSQSILSFGTGGEAVFCDGGISLECSNIFGNSAGDWTGFITPQLGASGNISADPLFCDAEFGDFRVAESSPCAPFSPPNTECGRLGSAYEECLGPTAVGEGIFARAYLHDVRPNPFQGNTEIRYELSAKQTSILVTLHVYDLRGRLIRTLRTVDASPGMNRASWDGRDNHGRRVTSGVYLLHLTVGRNHFTRRMVLLR